MHAHARAVVRDGFDIAFRRYLNRGMIASLTDIGAELFQEILQAPSAAMVCQPAVGAAATAAATLGAAAATSATASTTAKTGRARGKGKATPIPPADKVDTHVGGKEICLNYNRSTCTAATCPNKFVHAVSARASTR